MTTIALVVGLVALAGVVFLAFAYSALLVVVRGLQDRLEGAGAAPERPVERFAGGTRALVLVTEPTCLSCKDRIQELAGYRQRNPMSHVDFTVLQAAAGARPDGLPADVEFLVDAELVGALSVNVVPLGLVFDAAGNEVARSVLGDAAAFERLIAWADSDAEPAKQIETAPMGRG